MTVVAFEGPAGSGKTYRLMEELAETLRQRPLRSHERVLALTFMHGSRRRLDERLRAVAGLEGRFVATTVDSFAWQLVNRWRRLVRALGSEVPIDGEYERTCALAAMLLRRDTVIDWVGISYPCVLVDEAQDLSVGRSRMVEAMVESCLVLLAYDEFQCLDTTLLPIAISGWIGDACEPVVLQGCRRTEDSELLGAARAVRLGRPVIREGRRFKVCATPGHTNRTATYIANAIAWRRGGNVAVLTPARRGLAENAVARVSAGPVGRRQNGPYEIRWESSDEQAHSNLWGGLGLENSCTVEQLWEAADGLRQEPAIQDLCAWARRQRRIKGIRVFSKDELSRQLWRALSRRRQYGPERQSELAAMTVQQAKNREFDHVVLIWPYNVPNDVDRKRRLLYNAITRARRSCLVLVQSERLLEEPPFA